MDSKGQLSVEFLLLFLVVIIIISAVTIPLLSTSITASNDVSNVADAKSTVIEIANAINIVYSNGPGAKRTLDVYMPQSGTLTTITGNPTIIGVNETLSNGTKKFVNASIDYPNIISPLNLPTGTKLVTVYWNPSTNSITVT